MKGKIKYLTFSMAFLIVLYPFLLGGKIQLIILNFLISLVCVLAVYAVGHNRKNLVIAAAFGLPWFLLNWIMLFNPPPSPIMESVTQFFLILLYGFTAAIIFIFVLKSEKVTEDVLFGAVSIYLLIGGVFSGIYTIIDRLMPGAFYINPLDGAVGTAAGPDFLYYSFATLTTLGYGDIIPVVPQARSFAVLGP